MSKQKNIMVTKQEMTDKSEVVYSVYDIVEALITWVKDNKQDEIPVDTFEELIEAQCESY